MKLKKYRVVANPVGYMFFDGEALGKERYGFKNYHYIVLLDRDSNGTDSYSFHCFDSTYCLEITDSEEMPANTRPAFLSSNSNLLTAIGDKPSKITIEF